MPPSRDPVVGETEESVIIYSKRLAFIEFGALNPTPLLITYTLYYPVCPPPNLQTISVRVDDITLQRYSLPVTVVEISLTLRLVLSVSKFEPAIVRSFFKTGEAVVGVKEFMIGIVLV